MNQKKNIYELAIEMLEATNPYRNTSIDELHYTYIQANARNYVNLSSLLREQLKGKRRSISKEDALAKDYANCYQAISRAMVIYFEAYKPQSYAFLQATKSKFAGWLRNIAGRYRISNAPIPEELTLNPNDQDTAVVMLKELHDRRGKTVENMHEYMGISHRAIQKNLNKLDPGLAGDTSQFRIGGQPVEVKIDCLPAKSGKAKRYRTLNTLHPIVLLENQMQVGSLLKALAHSYYKEESGVCYSIGLDIWYQLSDYSKERVKAYFAANDLDLADYIEELENASPGSERESFQTERAMVEELGVDSLSQEELFAFVAKGAGRKCDLILKNQEKPLIGYELEIRREESSRYQPTETVYVAKGPKGNAIEFTYDEVESISRGRFF